MLQAVIRPFLPPGVQEYPMRVQSNQMNLNPVNPYAAAAEKAMAAQRTSGGRKKPVKACT
jgi:hypothetical protein